MKVTKKFFKGKQPHVAMEPSKTSRTRLQHHHNTLTPPLHLVPFCQLCFVFVSCVHIRVVGESGEGSAGCVVHVDGTESVFHCGWLQCSCYWAWQV